MPIPLDSRQLRAFSALARLGTVTGAARELDLTQGAVSHSMKALEKEIGCRLFTRGRRGVTLTSAGKRLQEHTDKILAEMAAARAIAR
jgi:LysR family transcriptional regulator, low CO2-responsive transcriptional regulator